MTNEQVIAVATNGWVFLGEPVPSPDPTIYQLTNAAVIRKWGTDRGLGQLALKGAGPETILDPAGAIAIERAALVYTLKVQCAPIAIPW